MKISFLTVVLTFLSLVSMAQMAGRVKVYFAGFTCNQETWDDAMQLDGKGDEVFLTFQFALSDANGNIKLKGENTTQTFGDATGAFSNRINVGSCVDLFGSKKGGIRAGDQYITNVAIGEFDIAATDILTITPVIWEWDPNQNALNTFLPKLKAVTTDLNLQTSKFLGSINNQIDPSRMNESEFISRTIFFFSFFLSSASDLYSSIENFVGKQETRPIGMDPAGKFVPTVIALNSQRVTFNSNNNIGYGLGVLPVTFDENALGNTREHGNYRILIRTEFIPSATQNTTTVVAPTSTQTIMPVSPTTIQTVTPVQTSTPTSTAGTTTQTTTTTNTAPETQTNTNKSNSKPTWKPAKKGQ